MRNRAVLFVAAMAVASGHLGFQMRGALDEYRMRKLLRRIQAELDES